MIFAGKVVIAVVILIVFAWGMKQTLEGGDEDIDDFHR